jgi:hypothetical protein
MHQWHRWASSAGAWPRSAYCPLALFSADETRVDAALHALLTTPQNNLHVFLNGAKQVHRFGFTLSPVNCVHVCAVA